MKTFLTDCIASRNRVAHLPKSLFNWFCMSHIDLRYNKELKSIDELSDLVNSLRSIRIEGCGVTHVMRAFPSKFLQVLPTLTCLSLLTLI